MEISKYLHASQIAHGERKASLVLKNAKVINVFTEEIYQADIAVQDGTIVGIGTYTGETEIDCRNRYVCPGLIDSHLHLESTLVAPEELIHQAALCGTTTFIVDPHESANVSGCAGVDYILNHTEKVSANVYVMFPSCVPATLIDDNGAYLTAKDMVPYMTNNRILGLGEVMDYSSVVNGNAEMHEKLELCKDKVKDGHAPFLSEEDLTAYSYAGIHTDHECVDYTYAMKERRNGITVLIRQGSAAKNLDAIVSGIVENNTDTSGFCFCTDDKHIEEIRKEGHINFNVREAIRLGISPLKAIKMATIQAAQCYGLQHLGAIAPGYQADILILDDLESMKVHQVLYRGEIIPTDISKEHHICPKELRNTIHLENFSKEQLVLPCSGKEMHVIQMIDGQIGTRDVLVSIPKTDNFQADETFKKIAVIERHKGSGKVGVGIVSGFCIEHGAIASSVSHDSHNIIVIGDNDLDMELAVRELIHTQGGYTVVENGSVYDTLPLPIMGLMSDAGYLKVNEKLEIMIKKAHEMGVSENMDPFITLSFMALPVIPEIRITPRGVYDVRNSMFISTE
ncbi:MAG: adenine deaminase [Lachnospiraceae bacterium]|nr:adenine deaminase [Lachnospiraceae bacterium]